MSEDLKVYHISSFNTTKRCKAIGVVVAKSKGDAVKLLRDTRWECSDITENELHEIELKEGVIFIDSYHR